MAFLEVVFGWFTSSMLLLLLLLLFLLFLLIDGFFVSRFLCAVCDAIDFLFCETGGGSSHHAGILDRAVRDHAL